MSFIELQKSFDRILISKNWNNVLLRNDIRIDIINSNFTANRAKLDERPIVEYLHNIDNEQLGNLRYRIFKLARDHYFEHTIKSQIPNPPCLKEIDHVYSQTSIYDSENSTTVRFNIIRDIVDCLEYILDLRKNLPTRCTDFKNAEPLQFPLGKRNLLAQLNAIKTLRFKILKLQTELHNLKKYMNGMEKMEKTLLNTSIRLKKLQKQNNILKSFLTIILIILITCSVSFLFLNCLSKMQSSKS